jgi:hypothetical protein
LETPSRWVDGLRRDHVIGRAGRHGNGRESRALISTEEYCRLKRRDREALGIEDFTEADAEAVRRAEPPRKRRRSSMH